MFRIGSCLAYASESAVEAANLCLPTDRTVLKAALYLCRDRRLHGDFSAATKSPELRVVAAFEGYTGVGSSAVILVAQSYSINRTIFLSDI